MLYNVSTLALNILRYSTKTDIYMYLLILSYNSGADHRVGNGVDVGWWYCSFLLEKQSHVVILRSFCGITTNNIKFQ